MIRRARRRTIPGRHRPSRLAIVILALALAAVGLTTAASAAPTDVTAVGVQTGPMESAPGAWAVLLADPSVAHTSVPPPAGTVDCGGDCIGVAQATFVVSYSGFPPAAQAAFQAAVDVWAASITSAVPIVVDARWTALPGGVLGGSSSVGFWRNFAGAPRTGTWYSFALANAIAGVDLAPAAPDIVASFANTGVSWYLGTDGNPPAGQYDLMSVVLHELGHGLGFTGSMSVSDGIGTYGSGMYVGFPLIYDHFTRTGSGTPLLSLPNDSSTLGSQLTSNNLYFNGTHANAANGGNPVKLYAPATWRQGTSYSHFDEATFPPGNPNSLMTPGLATAEAIHSPGPIALGVLEDLGWPDTAAPPPPPPPQGIPIERIFGQDAIGTSLAISADLFGSGAASAVVLARSDHFADALAGGPLAAANDGPLLITPGASQASALDPRVLAEIQRVLPAGGTVYVLGGTLALASGIDTELAALGYDVQRVMGANQYSTATAIADRLGNPPVVFEATGLGFADALSAVPAAIASNGAILLTQGPTQAPETAAYLAQHAPPTRYAIGGPLAAAGADPTAEAVFGQDLFGTSAAVAARFFPSAEVFGAATGLNFPDALSGGVFMGSPEHLGPVLLVNPDVPVPPPVLGYLASQAGIVQGYLFGGPLAVSEAVLAALANA